MDNDDLFLRNMSRTMDFNSLQKQKEGMKYGMQIETDHLGLPDDNNAPAYLTPRENNDYTHNYQSYNSHQYQREDDSDMNSDWETFDPNYNDTTSHNNEWGAESYMDYNQNYDEQNAFEQQNEYEISDAREDKQAFMLNEIVGKGFDQELFSKYLKDQKPNDGDSALDINNWNVKDLKDAVYEFQDQQMSLEINGGNNKPINQSIDFNRQSYKDSNDNSFEPQKLAALPRIHRKSISHLGRKSMGMDSKKFQSPFTNFQPQTFKLAQSKVKNYGGNTSDDQLSSGMSEMSDNDSSYNMPLYENKKKIPRLKIKKVRNKKNKKTNYDEISDIEEAYEDNDPSQLKEDTLNNLFVLLECPPKQDIDESVVERPRLSSFANKIGMKGKQKPKKQVIDTGISPEYMQKSKYTLNKQKYMPVDIKVDETVLSKKTTTIKCAIVASKVQEQTDYYIFRSRVLIFKLQSKVMDGLKESNWQVRRFEMDFYTLRNILALSYGQCFIPSLSPAVKEYLYQKRSLRSREKNFSRFLRGILRHADLSAHPFVKEFLQVDHHKKNRKDGMKDFSKRLLQLERELIKNKDSNNNFYKICSLKNKLPMQNEFLEKNLIDYKNGLNIAQNEFNIPKFVQNYESLIFKVLGETTKFQSQGKGLVKSFTKMHQKLKAIQYIYHEDHGPMFYIFSDISKLIENQQLYMKNMLTKMSALLGSHFGQQQHVINQSVRPFLPKIDRADKLHKEQMAQFLKKREIQKDEVKASSGLLTLEKAFLDDKAGPEQKQRYFNELYRCYVDCERQFLKKDCKEVEKTESLLMFTRNQFVREFRRMMEEDECVTLQYQMVYVAKIFECSLKGMNNNTEEFTKMLEKRPSLFKKIKAEELVDQISTFGSFVVKQDDIIHAQSIMEKRQTGENYTVLGYKGQEEQKPEINYAYSQYNIDYDAPQNVDQYANYDDNMAFDSNNDQINQNYDYYDTPGEPKVQEI